MLIVDNDEDWLCLLEKLLAAEGYAVLKAMNCSEAIAKTGAARPDCVIADLKLGSESGMDICCHIKSSPELRHIPVIMLSGAEPPADRCPCKCDAYVCKADGTAQLLATLRRTLALDIPGL